MTDDERVVVRAALLRAKAKTQEAAGAFPERSNDSLTVAERNAAVAIATP